METIEIDERIEKLDIMIAALTSSPKVKKTESGLILIKGGHNSGDPETGPESAWGPGRPSGQSLSH